MKNLPNLLLSHNLWKNNDNSIWLFSTFKLHRNLKTHFFPHKLKPQLLEDLTLMLKDPLLKNPDLKKSSFFFMKDLKPHDFQLLYESFVPEKDYSRFRGSEGILIDQSSNFHALLNTEDHLVLNMVDEKNQLEKSLHKLSTYENKLSKEIEFAFSSKFGFLTSDFEKCGTGLEVSLVLHLPALIHTNSLESVIEKINSKTLTHSPLLGEDYLGDLMRLKNEQKINISEQQIIKTLHSHVLTLIIAEKKKREELLNGSKNDLKNKVSKAFGTLKHAHLLEVKEALNLVSLCKLGIELHWIQKISIKEINELFFTLRKGFLEIINKNLDVKVEEKRAEYIKNVLKKAVI